VNLEEKKETGKKKSTIHGISDEIVGRKTERKSRVDSCDRNARRERTGTAPSNCSGGTRTGKRINNN